MKTNKNFLVIGIMSISMFMWSNHVKAQGGFKEASVAHPAQSWNPVKLGADGGNIQNGVEFYSQNTNCGSGKVKLVKLVNKNNYAVKVSMQSSATSSAVNIMVPASATIEGTCSATDGNIAKLVMTPPVATTNEEKQQNAEFFKSHVVVSKM